MFMWVRADNRLDRRCGFASKSAGIDRAAVVEFNSRTDNAIHEYRAAFTVYSARIWSVPLVSDGRASSFVPAAVVVERWCGFGWPRALG